MQKVPVSQPLSFRDVGLFALLFLLFFQLVTALVEATYTFGLLSVDLPPEAISVLFLLTPLLLLIFPHLLGGRMVKGLAITGAELALLCQAIALAAAPRGKMIFSGLGIGLLLVSLPALLLLAGRQWGSAKASRVLGCGLAFAGMLSIAAKSLELNGVFSNEPGYRLAAWALLLLTGYWLVTRLRTGAPGLPAADPPPPAAGRTFAAWLGLFSALILLYFAFTAPSVIARWTGASPVWVTALTLLPLGTGIIVYAGLPRVRAVVSHTVLLAWNGLFVLALGALLLSYQIFFPVDPGAYPLAETVPGPLAWIALVVTLLLHPVIYLDFALFAGQMADDMPTPRAVAGAISIGAVYFMSMIFAQIFTTVYDYVPMIGPLFRDRFFLVMVFPGIVLLLVSTGLRATGNSADPGKPYKGLAAAAVGLPAILLLASIASLARPLPPPDRTSLRVMTYNIQQGYDAQGRKNFTGLLAAIRPENPDILGLQESDMARIANGNADVVQYLANELDMYAYFGPSTVTGTFGIALLSRYPIENPRTFYLYSSGEQTAAIQAQIVVGEKTFNVLVTHLGNGGPILQQQQVLQRLDGLDNILAMGDFNFRPASEQYRLTTAVLDDAWDIAGAQTSPPGQDVSRRIDHIFLSPGARVSSARFLPEGPSDHPALIIESGW